MFREQLNSYKNTQFEKKVRSFTFLSHYCIRTGSLFQKPETCFSCVSLYVYLNAQLWRGDMCSLSLGSPPGVLFSSHIQIICMLG